MSDNTCKVVLALISLATTALVVYKEIKLAELSAAKKDSLAEMQ